MTDAPREGGPSSRTPASHAPCTVPQDGGIQGSGADLRKLRDADVKRMLVEQGVDRKVGAWVQLRGAARCGLLHACKQGSAFEPQDMSYLPPAQDAF